MKRVPKWIARVRQGAQRQLAAGPSRYDSRVEAGPKFKTFVRIRNVLDRPDQLTDADCNDLCWLLDELLSGKDVSSQFLHKARGRPPATYVAVFIALDCKLRGRGQGAAVRRDWNLTDDQLRRRRTAGNAEAKWWMENNDRQTNVENVATARRMYVKRNKRR